MQLVKVQRGSEMKPNFFSPSPTRNQTQGLMKTDFFQASGGNTARKMPMAHGNFQINEYQTSQSYAEIASTLPLRSTFSLSLSTLFSII